MSGLGRSLSLNTGSSLFGGSSQPQQSGGLFGSSTSTSQPASSFGLSGSTATQPAQSGRLFGGNTTASAQVQKPSPFSFGAAAQSQPSTSQPAPAPSGGLFGNAAAPSQPASGGLFGQAAAKPGGLFGSTMTTTVPQAGGLFGSTNAATSAPAAGGLFGSSTTAPSQPQPGGLFGRATAQPQPTGGLFGASTGTTPTPATGGLFGRSTTQAQPTGGLFGASTNTNTTSAATGGLFGTSRPANAGLFGSSTTQPQQPTSSLFGSLNNATAQPQQQTVQAVTIDWNNVKPTTRFNELHEEVQKAILFIDEVIQSSMKASMQCSETLPGLGQQVEILPQDVEYLDTRLETVEGALSRDAVAVGQAKQVVEKDSEDAVRLFRAVENLKLPSQFHYSSIGGGFNGSVGADVESDIAATDLLGYFNARTAELEKKAEVFGQNQKEVEMHLRTVEGSAIDGLHKLARRRTVDGEGNGVDIKGEGLREVAGVMRTFEDAILRVAERVGESRQKVVDVSLGAMGR